MGAICSCASEAQPVFERQQTPEADEHQDVSDKILNAQEPVQQRQISVELQRQITPQAPEVTPEEPEEVKKHTSPNGDQSDWTRPDYFVERTRGDLSNALMSIVENPCDLKDLYSLKDKLGAGKFGCVREASVTANGVERAVKTIQKKDMVGIFDALRGELVIMKMFDHPNMVTICEIFEDRESVHLVMKICRGNHLQEYVENNACLNEVQASVMMRDLLRGVSYMHSCHVCHRDLKGENCLLTTHAPLERNRMKLCDFGLSKRFTVGGKELTGKVGSHTHMAPEVVMNTEPYTERCDAWSCGIIFHQLLSGYLPFEAEENVLKDKLAFSSTEWADVSTGAVRLVELLVDRNIETRLTVLDALGNEWLLENLAKAKPPPPPEGAEPTSPSSPPVPVKPLAPAGYPARVLKYRNFNKWKQAALRMIANMQPEQETTIARELFLSLDVRCTGKISWESLCKACEHTIGEVDAYGDTQEISYTEFLAATCEKKRSLTDKMCKAAYQAFDKSADQLVSMTDLREGRLIGELSPKELQRITRDLGFSGEEETIELSAFTHMLRIDRVRATMKTTGKEPVAALAEPISPAASGA